MALTVIIFCAVIFLIGAAGQMAAIIIKEKDWAAWPVPVGMVGMALVLAVAFFGGRGA